MAEVLVVMVIFGLLAAMAVPKMNLGAFRGASAGSVAGSTVMAAARAAVARQHDVVVAVDQPGRRLRIHYDQNNDGMVGGGEWARWEPLPEGVVFSRAGAPAGRIGSSPVSFRGREDGMPAVTFLRNGSASEEGGFYLATAEAVSRGRSANVRMVVVDRATARLSWYIYDGARWKREF